MVRRSLGLLFVAVCILSSAQGAWAATATEQLKSAIDRVLATIDNPALKGDGKILERRAAVRRIANEIFDFGEIARRSLPAAGALVRELASGSSAEARHLAHDLARPRGPECIHALTLGRVKIGGQSCQGRRFLTEHPIGGPVGASPESIHEWIV